MKKSERERADEIRELADRFKIRPDESERLKSVRDAAAAALRRLEKK